MAEGEEAPSIVDIEDPGAAFSHPIAYRLRLQLVGRTLVVRGELETTARFTCALCLKEFESPIRVHAFGRELETGSAAGEIIDLTGDIREDIILAIPAKPLCRADCRGLCPLCGGPLDERDCGCRDSGPSDSPFAGLNPIPAE